MKTFFVTWYNLLMPGTLTCPLLPGIPAKRHWAQSVGYVAYVYFLVQALRKPDKLEFEDIIPVVGTLAVLTPFDLVTFQASRGEHSGYMIVCCLFPWEHALTGLRFCQAALWFFAGTAKMGPWMKYVNAFMMPNSKVLAVLALFGVPISDMLYTDRRGKKGARPDVNPSALLRLLAHFGCIAEVALGPMCLFAPSVGVPFSFAFHGYILSMTPFASVMEWNVFCLYLSYALFGGVGASEGFTGHTAQELLGAAAAMPSALLGFLVFVLLIGWLVGWLVSKLVGWLVDCLVACSVVCIALRVST